MYVDAGKINLNIFHSHEFASLTGSASTNDQSDSKLYHDSIMVSSDTISLIGMASESISNVLKGIERSFTGL